MRILWLCNIMLPAIAEHLNLSYSNREGWLTGVYNRFAGERESKAELGICFPMDSSQNAVFGRVSGDASEKSSAGEAALFFPIGKVRCYGFRESLNRPDRYDESLERQLKKILDDFRPDVVHIFGTEFPHARALTRVWDRPEKTLVGIQGLCCKIAEVYTQGLPKKVVDRVTFRDWLKRDSLRQQQAKFYLRALSEKEVISWAGHITGRTGFDREVTAKINPDAKYYRMNEIMRDAFYSGRWEREHCEPGSIFMGQGDYPIKGFHSMLEAMPLIVKKRPDIRLYVAGNSIVDYLSIKDRIKISSYGQYLHELIRRHRLEDKVVILGKLDAEAMKARFLKSSVFVCPSIIENSPNTVAEAMLLGVPVVAAAVGGIPDMITDGREGILFESGDVTALAGAVLKAWDEDVARTVSEGAAARAAAVHDRDMNYERLMDIYHEINLHF